MLLPNAYRELLQLSEGEVVAVSGTRPIDIASIDRGIVFFMARWSGKSQISFRSLNRVLRPSCCLGFQLFVADVDEQYVQDLMDSIGLVSSGGGETLWVRNGRVVGTLSNYNDRAREALCEFTNIVCGNAE